MIQTQTTWTANRLKAEIPASYNQEKAVIFLFFDTTQDTAPLVAQLRNSHPKAHLVGCSGSGQIQGSEIHDDRILLHCVLFESPSSHIRSVSHPIDAPESSFGIGERISRDLAAPDLKGVFVLSEGLNINGTSLIQGGSLPQQEPDRVWRLGR